nr:MAG TPA: hypothetical protein [Caudoviricetes sp.]
MHVRLSSTISHAGRHEMKGDTYVDRENTIREI